MLQFCDLYVFFVSCMYSIYSFSFFGVCACVVWGNLVVSSKFALVPGVGILSAACVQSFVFVSNALVFVLRSFL